MSLFEGFRSLAFLFRFYPTEKIRFLPTINSQDIQPVLLKDIVGLLTGYTKMTVNGNRWYRSAGRSIRVNQGCGASDGLDRENVVSSPNIANEIPLVLWPKPFLNYCLLKLRNYFSREALLGIWWSPMSKLVVLRITKLFDPEWYGYIGRAGLRVLGAEMIDCSATLKSHRRWWSQRSVLRGWSCFYYCLIHIPLVIDSCLTTLT